MAVATGTIEIGIPVKTVYNQWTQFEEFPAIMTGVKDVEQIDDKRLRWKQGIGGHEKEWVAEIVEQIPDRSISWNSIEGDEARGLVTFTELNTNETRVELSIEYETEGVVEKGANLFGIDNGRINQDLQKFKDFIESRKQETGAWRGTIHDK